MDYISIVNLILLILPGFIIISVKNLFIYTKNIKTFDKTLQSIIATILFWFFVYLIPTECYIRDIFYRLQIIDGNSSVNISDFINLTPSFLLIYIISFIIGILLGLLFRFYKSYKLYDKLYEIIFGKTSYEYVWEETFKELMSDNNRNKIVFIKTISGDMFCGEIHIVSHNPEDRAICFSSLKRYDKYNDKILEEAINSDGNFDYDRFYIKDTNIEYLIIFPKAEQINTNLFAKKLEKTNFVKKLFEKIKKLFGK